MPSKKQTKDYTNELNLYRPARRAKGAPVPLRYPTGEIFISSADNTLPKAILNCGDEEFLTLYKNTYSKELRAMEDGDRYIAYLEQRIAGLTKKASLKNEANEAPQELNPAEIKGNGSIYLNGVSQKEFQSSGNGCWSVTYSNLLNAKGADLTQKEIRAYRPNIPLSEASSMANEDTDEFNKDNGANPFNMSGLAMEVLPNTAMREWGITMPNQAGDKYIETAGKAILNEIEKALVNEKAPVAIKYNGHYLTVVGLNGDRIIFKDPLQLRDEDNNPIITDPDHDFDENIYEILRDVQKSADEKDISLIWLSELRKNPSTGKIEELSDYPELSLEDNGVLSIKSMANSDVLLLDGLHDVEYTVTAPSDVNGVQPSFRTKFPKVIRPELLREIDTVQPGLYSHLFPTLGMEPAEKKEDNLSLFNDSEAQEPTFFDEPAKGASDESQEFTFFDEPAKGASDESLEFTFFENGKALSVEDFKLVGNTAAYDSNPFQFEEKSTQPLTDDTQEFTFFDNPKKDAGSEEFTFFDEPAKSASDESQEFTFFDNEKTLTTEDFEWLDDNSNANKNAAYDSNPFQFEEKNTQPLTDGTEEFTFFDEPKKGAASEEFTFFNEPNPFQWESADKKGAANGKQGIESSPSKKEKSSDKVKVKKYNELLAEEMAASGKSKNSKKRRTNTTHETHTIKKPGRSF